MDKARPLATIETSQGKTRHDKGDNNMKIFRTRARKVRVIRKELLNRIKMATALEVIRVNFQGSTVK